MVIVSAVFQLALVIVFAFVQNKSDIASLSWCLNDCPVSVVSLTAHNLDENSLPLFLFLHIPASYFELVSGKGQNASEIQTDI